MTQRPPRWIVAVGLVTCLALAMALLNDHPAAAQGQTLNSLEQQVFDLMNQQRAANGLPALQIDWRLVQAARDHNAAMISSGVFSHQAPGELPLCASGANNDRYEAVGYGWQACGENIAAGQTSPQQVMNDWMNSSGHRANILNASFRDFGVGYTTGGSYGYYWTQDFGTSSGATVPTATRSSATATRTPTRTATPVAQPSRTPTPAPTLAAQLESVTTGVYRPSNGNVYLKNANTTGIADTAFYYGNASDKPVTGDWNGDGMDTIGIYRSGTFYLRNANSTGVADVMVSFGMPGDQPVVGDWNGDGVTTIGVYRNGMFFLRNSNTPGGADMSFAFGGQGDVPVAGDWNGVGGASIGIFRSSTGTFYLRNANTTGAPDITVVYGASGDVPVVGDWDNNGTATIGVFRGGMFMLRNTNTSGVAERSFALGGRGDLPIAGNWDNKP